MSEADRTEQMLDVVRRLWDAVWRDGDVAKLDELLGKLIARLEARDDQGRSLFIESTKPADEEGT